MHAYRPDAAILDRTEKGAEAVDERLAADKADIFMRLGLQEQMLAGAEADLEPDIVDGRWEKLGQGGRRRIAEIEA